jgi:hypothetical protein
MMDILLVFILCCHVDKNAVVVIVVIVNLEGAMPSVKVTSSEKAHSLKRV